MSTIFVCVYFYICICVHMCACLYVVCTCTHIILEEQRWCSFFGHMTKNSNWLCLSKVFNFSTWKNKLRRGSEHRNINKRELVGFFSSSLPSIVFSLRASWLSRVEFYICLSSRLLIIQKTKILLPRFHFRIPNQQNQVMIRKFKRLKASSPTTSFYRRIIGPRRQPVGMIRKPGLSPHISVLWPHATSLS